MEYDNRNTGVLFSADKKSEKSPDMTGTWTDENGKEFHLAAWKKVSKGGREFWSVSRGYEKGEQQAKAAPKDYASQENTPDQDVPF